MSADFTPPLKPYSDINKFRFWCQKVLPLVYDDSLSYYELLNKVVDYLNRVIDNMGNVEDNVQSLYDAFVELQNYVNQYFDSQDWQSMVNNKIDQLVIDGYFEEIIEPLVTEVFNRIVVQFNEFKEDVNDDIDDFKREVNSNIQTQNSNIEVLEARMDTFASLPDGSTSGDAELLDIRVGVDGTIYPSAGDAVRSQISGLDSTLSNDILSITNNISIIWGHGGIDNATGQNNNNGSTTRSRTDYYKPINEIGSLYNGSGSSLYVICYTKIDDTYTFDTSYTVNNGTIFRGYCNDTRYYRLDLRTGFDGASSVVLTVANSDLYQKSYSDAKLNEAVKSSYIEESVSLTEQYTGLISPTNGTVINPYYASNYCVTEPEEIGDADAILIPYDYEDTTSVVAFYTTTTVSSFVSGVTGYLKSGTIIPIPDDVVYFRLTVPNNETLACKKIYFTDKTLSEKGKSADAKAVGDVLHKMLEVKVNYDNTTTEYLSDIKSALKKNVCVTFFANFVSFTKLLFGLTKSNDYANDYDDYYEIDTTNLTMHRRGQNDVTWAHGLTMSDYICVMLKFDKEYRYSLTIYTNGGTFNKNNNVVLGDSYFPFSVITGTDISNKKLSMTCEDFKKDIILFGDSYLSYSQSRWVYYLGDYIDNLCINGYPGENSTSARSNFDNLINLMSNKYAIWCLGMNDTSDIDDNTPNTTWLSNVQHFIDLCEENNITPVLTTIPSTAVKNHRAKSAWVRNSGYNYIDFAKAVNNDNSGGWYDGMLAQDGEHPTVEGAICLCMRAFADFPQIMVKS